jgi:hypothetical protein
MGRVRESCKSNLSGSPRCDVATAIGAGKLGDYYGHSRSAPLNIPMPASDFRTTSGYTFFNPLAADRHYRYYVLVAACVLARRVDWLRNACVAAALLFPAVAAIHGIVLAAVHRNGEFLGLFSSP